MNIIKRTINLYSKEQIDSLQIGETTDAAAADGSLWARIKNALARIGVLETADTNNVKKTGTSVVTGDLQVPTTPPNIDSAVNQAYVESTVSGVNNLLHKTGNEESRGIKGFQQITIKPSNSTVNNIVNSMIYDSTTVPSSTTSLYPILYVDKNNNRLERQSFMFRASGGYTKRYYFYNRSSGTEKTVYLSIDVTQDGHITLSITNANNQSVTIATI